MHPLSCLLAATLAAHAAPPVVNDARIHNAFQTGVGAFAESGDFPDAAAIKASLASVPATAPAGLEVRSAPAATPDDAVFLIGSVYKCGRCDDWHPGGVATAWALGSDGLMATNQHVFANVNGAAMGVCDRHGNTHPVTEVIAADPAADIALFRVKAAALPTLAVGATAGIGDDVRVISHPHRNYFFHTFGKVARYVEHPTRNDGPVATWMNITADFAKGSSGGPVLNDRFEVVGMVASTRSIYYNSNNGEPKGPLQMVIKNCVPAGAIHKILGSPASAGRAPAESPGQR